MIARIAGTIELVRDNAVILRPLTTADLASVGLTTSSPAAAGAQTITGLVQGVEVLVPAYLAARLRLALGQIVTLTTLFYLEGQVQGTSFTPRLVGFGSEQEREFFVLLTDVKGIGNRKALRAMAEPPHRIALAITRGDAKALTQLPEIGKKLAETMILELREKAVPFAQEPNPASSAANGTSAADFASRAQRSLRSTSMRPPAEQDAIAALMAMGDVPSEAERRIDLALSRLSEQKPQRAVTDASELIGLALRGG